MKITVPLTEAQVRACVDGLARLEADLEADLDDGLAERGDRARLTAARNAHDAMLEAYHTEMDR